MPGRPFTPESAAYLPSFSFSRAPWPQVDRRVLPGRPILLNLSLGQHFPDPCGRWRRSVRNHKDSGFRYTEQE